MSEFIHIEGGAPLSGEVKVGGAKNAVLPMLIASLLTAEKVEYSNVPNLKDVGLTLHLLRHFGAQVDYSGEQVSIQIPQLTATEASYSLVKAIRASFWVMGPLLARGGAARVALPGGDIIGARPVDMHIAALEQMGANIKVKHGVVYAMAPKGLHPADITFRFPSVGATHQVLLAAALTPGETRIQGAACEPEVVALADLINQMGGRIEGAGTPEIQIHGKKELHGASVELIGDRIEAATYALATAAVGGDVLIRGFQPLHFGDFNSILDKMGVTLEPGVSSLRVKHSGKLKSVQVSTAPFPGFATDIQAPLMAALCLADGESSIEENIFEGRFGHVSELCRMGASIRIEDRTAIITGIQEFTSAPVEAFDIRAAAALVIAALAADGESMIHEPQHIRRGYSNLEDKLRGLGAKIGARLKDPEDYIFTGC